MKTGSRRLLNWIQVLMRLDSVANEARSRCGLIQDMKDNLFRCYRDCSQVLFRLHACANEAGSRCY